MQVNLMDVMSRFHPGIQCETSNPNDYSLINWLNTATENIPTEELLLEQKLALEKEIRIEELSKQCESTILQGFESSALGTTHKYDSDVYDQINLMGSWLICLNISGSIPYACKDIATGLKTYETHTAAQMAQVLSDGATFKLLYLQTFNALRDQVNACTSHSEIYQVVWPY